MRAYTAETDVLFFDVETTGLPPKGAKWENDFAQFPDIVQISWSIGDKEKDYIIKPDSTDKYAISKKASLIGVYNINKGYRIGNF